MNATLSTVDVAKTWLLQMGQAARANGLTIQYCTSSPRHAMQSLEIPVVTQVDINTAPLPPPLPPQPLPSHHDVETGYPSRYTSNHH